MPPLSASCPEFETPPDYKLTLWRLALCDDRYIDALLGENCASTKLSGIVSAAPNLGVALGYDVSEAFELVDS